MVEVLQTSALPLGYGAVSLKGLAKIPCRPGRIKAATASLVIGRFDRSEPRFSELQLLLLGLDVHGRTSERLRLVGLELDLDDSLEARGAQNARDSDEH